MRRKIIGENDETTTQTKETETNEVYDPLFVQTKGLLGPYESSSTDPITKQSNLNTERTDE